jgi:DNA mismatch repair protein MutS
MTYRLDPNAPECSTPLMKQFVRLKQEAGDAFLFFRMGDFYELFAEDAVNAAPLLGVTLTSRDKRSENPMPMAGVPFHSATNYIQKILNAGKKVAIAEQILPEGMSADQIKGIVERRIIRTFTPAVQFEIGTESSPRYLATLMPAGEKRFVLALLEPATGEIRISDAKEAGELHGDPALSEIRHFLNPGTKTPPEFLATLEARNGALLEEVAPNLIAATEILPFLREQFDQMVLPPLLGNEAAARALAFLIRYVTRTQGIDRLPHLHDPKPLHENGRLVVGPETLRHLDLGDLITLIDRTATSMGARRLRPELEAPLRHPGELRSRQEAVRELARDSLGSRQIHEDLKGVYDLDRILGRIATRLASPRDTYALAESLEHAFRFRERLSHWVAPVLRNLSARFDAAAIRLKELSEKTLRIQNPEAPTHLRDGGIFSKGADPELDRLLGLTEDGERFLIELETREREQTGISSLKVKYNRVFGYFIEISSANLKHVPSHYQRKQTMVGGERFFTEELKRFEEEILTASSKQKALEARLFEALLDEFTLHAPDLKKLSDAIGELDALLSLSFLAGKPGWNFPEIDESRELVLSASRHPVVEAALSGEFVPNDLELGESAHTLILTGPNMGGKSTIMRQVAQIILLGQAGAPVPAARARWGIFHSLYTRIGAQDAIAKGQSTFMVEMVELAHILKHADERSFIVLDEVGRGTSTFDGMSVARASLEYLHRKSGARIVFATHYHELTELEALLPGIKNAHMKVLEDRGRLTFLYEIAPGRSSKSFGIQVAELAGLPKSVVKQAWEVLKGLENGKTVGETAASQLSLFASGPSDEASPEASVPSEITELIEEINKIDPDSMRPIEALQCLAALKDRLAKRP